jgi:hypothetical protein
VGHFNDPAFITALRDELRGSNRQRLHRAEDVLAALSEDERVVLADLALSMADRPPISERGWEAQRAFLQAIAYDIFDHTADPDDATGILANPRLVEIFREHGVNVI